MKPASVGEVTTTHGIVRERIPEGNMVRLRLELCTDNQENEVKTVVDAPASPRGLHQ